MEVRQGGLGGWEWGWGHNADPALIIHDETLPMLFSNPPPSYHHNHRSLNVSGFSSENRNYFGELALLYDAPRAATVTAAGEVICWGLDRVTFKQILQDATQKQRTLYKKFLEQVPVLAPLSVYERLTIADALQPKTFSEGDNIIVEGSEGFEFFIVESGSVICTKIIDGIEKTVSDPLGPGDYFGELSLITNENRAATVTAHADTTCLCID